MGNPAFKQSGTIRKLADAILIGIKKGPLTLSCVTNVDELVNVSTSKTEIIKKTRKLKTWKNIVQSCAYM